MKKVWICGILTVLCIIATVLLRAPLDNVEPDYQEVKVTVLSSATQKTTVKTGYSRSSLSTHKIRVLYAGEEYDLKNAHDSYSYREGAMVTAYLYNGKMYANVEGVKNATPAGIAYFTALIGSIGLFAVTMILWSKAGSKKQKTEGA